MVAFRAEMKDVVAEPAFDNAAGDVAGTRDRIISIVRHAEPVENALHGNAGPRRIGNEDDGAAARAKPRQRLAGRAIGGNAVMDDAPDVGQQHVVGLRQRFEMFEKIGQRVDTSARRARARCLDYSRRTINRQAPRRARGRQARPAAAPGRRAPCRTRCRYRRRECAGVPRRDAVCRPRRRCDG